MRWLDAIVGWMVLCLLRNLRRRHMLGLQRLSDARLRRRGCKPSRKMPTCRWGLDVQATTRRLTTLLMFGIGSCVSTADRPDRPGTTPSTRGTEPVLAPPEPATPLLRIWLEDLRCAAVKRLFVRETERRSGPEFVKLGWGHGAR